MFAREKDIRRMRYIGGKSLLLKNIEELINVKASSAETLCDIFSGTAVVSRHFKPRFEIISNDFLYFSYVLQRGTIENDSVPEFKGLLGIGIGDPIDYFNELQLEAMEEMPNEKRFFQNTYAPIGGRMYINNENALRIDFARNKVEEWKNEKLLTEDEYFYLVAAIVEGIPFVSNISGTYGAFHKKWERRSFKTFQLFRLNVYSNGKHNKCYNQDGVELLKHISGDILYIDPPYNERQYLPNYHVLETAAKYDFPEVRGVTGQRSYENNKSDFCLKSKAITAFEQLIDNAQFKHIILSYSTDGLMKLKDIEEVMKKYGVAKTFDIIKIPYRRYKSRHEANFEEELSELLVYVEKRA